MKSTNNPDRSNPVPPQEIHSKFKEVIANLPGKSLMGEKAPNHVLGQLLCSPDIAKLFIPYWIKSKSILSLSVREQEFIILRTAYRYGSDYVWGHHVPVALEADVSEKDIEQLILPIDEMQLSEKERILLQTTDEIVSNANVVEQTWSRLKTYYNDKQILDVITVVSQYLLFNSVNNIFGIRLENESMPTLGKIK